MNCSDRPDPGYQDCIATLGPFLSCKESGNQNIYAIVCYHVTRLMPSKTEVCIRARGKRGEGTNTRGIAKKVPHEKSHDQLKEQNTENKSTHMKSIARKVPPRKPHNQLMDIDIVEIKEQVKSLCKANYINPDNSICDGNVSIYTGELEDLKGEDVTVGVISDDGEATVQRGVVIDTGEVAGDHHFFVVKVDFNGRFAQRSHSGATVALPKAGGHLDLVGIVNAGEFCRQKSGGWGSIQKLLDRYHVVHTILNLCFMLFGQKYLPNVNENSVRCLFLKSGMEYLEHTHERSFQLMKKSGPAQKEIPIQPGMHIHFKAPLMEKGVQTTVSSEEHGQTVSVQYLFMAMAIAFLAIVLLFSFSDFPS